MQIRNILPALLLAALLPVCAAEKKPQPPPKFKLSDIRFSVDNRADKVSYAVNEKMVFTFSMEFDETVEGAPKDMLLRWTRSGDDGFVDIGMRPIGPGRPVVLETSSACPGFVRINALVTDSGGNGYRYMKGDVMRSFDFEGALGCEIETLKCSSEEPADFREYWTKQRDRLAAVPLKYTMTKITDPVPADPKAKIEKRVPDGFEMFAVRVDCAGPRPVTGYLLMPVGATEKSLTARVGFMGYGTPTQRAGWGAQQGTLMFCVNAHGYELEKDEAYYKQFFADIQKNSGYAFDFKENADRDTAYFNGMALRVMRAFDFVKALPQWNGKDLIATGGSQGGLQSIWAGALEPQLTACEPSVPWCCDIKRGGWMPSFTPALRYYDSVFHARHIPKTCLLNITRAGLGDTVCPPAGIAALYNAATCPKRIVWVQGSTHMFTAPDLKRFTMESK